MKKFLLTSFAMIAMAVCANAQIKLEAEAGLNVSKVHDSTWDITSDSGTGFNVGLRATAGLPIEGLYANAGAFLSLKGGELLGGKMKPYYLDIPVHVGYEFAVTSAFSVFAEVGPYLGVGLFGNTKYDSSNGGSVSYSLFSGDDAWSRLDLGVGARAGVAINKVSVFVGYDQGLLNISGTSDDKCNNTNLYVGVGYRF